MDPTHHEKIVDKLMQYRGKIPKTGQLADKAAELRCSHMRHEIDEMIELIEWFAIMDKKGLIR